MARAILLRDVRRLDPVAGLDDRIDVLLEDGVIRRAGRGAGDALLGQPGVHVVEGRGRWLMPGFVDLHVHFREPGEEHKEDIASGLRAAVAGGFVAVCAMANTKPVNDARIITELMIARSKEAALARLHPIGAVTKGLLGQELTEVADLRDAGAVGISDDGRCVTNSLVMRRALEYARTFDMPVIQHAEDHALTDGADMHEGAVSTRLGLRGWPRTAEDVIIARDCILAEAAKARYHVAHLSTKGAARLVAEAKGRGIAVTAEVTPHHLLLTDEAIAEGHGYRTSCKVNPPLREADDVAALRKALADGTIDAIATDHAPHHPRDKEVEFSAARPGMIGLEICLPLLLDLVRTGELPLMRLIHALTAGPAKVVGIDVPRAIEGARADLVLVEPEATFRIERASLASKSTNTPFLGREVRGAVDATFVGGRLVHVRHGSHGLHGISST